MKFFTSFLSLPLLFLGTRSVTGLHVPDMLKIVQEEYKVSDDASGGHVWVFQEQQHQVEEEQLVTLVFDTHANRMRLMSPITTQQQYQLDDPNLLRKALEANFGSTLDVRYSISNNVMMAAYLHPLEELTEKQFRRAIDQVTHAAKNFGTSFSSGSWTYYGRGPAVGATNKQSKEEKVTTDTTLVEGTSSSTTE